MIINHLLVFLFFSHSVLTANDRGLPFEIFSAVLAQFNHYDLDTNERLSKMQIAKMVNKKFDEQISVDSRIQLSQKFYKQAVVSYFWRFDRDGDGLSRQEFQKIINQQMQSNDNKMESTSEYAL